MNGKKPDSGELFYWIAKLSSEAEWTMEETREALSEAGIHSDEVTDRALQLVTRLKKESPWYWKAKAHARRRELLEKVRSRVGVEAAGLTRPQLLEKLKEGIDRLP